MSNILNGNRLGNFDNAKIPQVSNIPQSGKATLDTYDPATHERNLNDLQSEYLLKIAGGNFDKVNPNKINAYSGIMQNILQNQT
jgi:hypothetical protein